MTGEGAGEWCKRGRMDGWRGWKPGWSRWKEACGWCAEGRVPAKQYLTLGAKKKKKWDTGGNETSPIHLHFGWRITKYIPKVDLEFDGCTRCYKTLQIVMIIRLCGMEVRTEAER